MNWEELLVGFYVFIDDEYITNLQFYTERFSNNKDALENTLSDSEAMTIHLYGLMLGFRQIKDIYNFSKAFLCPKWFNKLPSYQKFNERINRLSVAFVQICESLINKLSLSSDLIDSQGRINTLIDSMPIIMAKNARSYKAKVATEVADQCFCATKKIWYHGVKLHVLGAHNPKKLPIPLRIELSTASDNDNTIFKEQVAPRCRGINVYADKIYYDTDARVWLSDLFNINVRACEKRRVNQKELHADQNYYNTGISSIRQPIESFFNWLNVSSGIQDARLVRSTKGLMKHIYARLALCLYKLIF